MRDGVWWVGNRVASCTVAVHGRMVVRHRHTSKLVEGFVGQRFIEFKRWMRVSGGYRNSWLFPLDETWRGDFGEEG